MLRPLSAFKARVAKLFGRHMSPEEQAAALAGAPVALAVGTPHRLASLLAADALKLDRTRLVLLDVRRDAKGFNVLDHPNLRDDTATLIRDHLHARLTAPGSALKLGVY